MSSGIQYLHGINPYKTPKYTNTCGPAAMGTILDFYNVAIPGLEKKVLDERDGKYHYDTIEIIDRICDDKQALDILNGALGTSPDKVVGGLKHYGLRNVAIGHSGFGNIGWGDLYNNLKSWVSSNCPVICLIDAGKLVNAPWFTVHYVVVHDIDDQKNILFTGWSQQSKMDEGTFLSAWSCNNLNLGSGLFSHTAIFARP